jgi:hypothetical protein
MKRIALLTAVLGLFGCVHPIVHDVRTEAGRGLPRSFRTPRACQISVEPVVDRRPVNEVVEIDQAKVRYVLPLLIWFQWSSAGPIYANPAHYDANLVPSLQMLLGDVVKDSGVCSGAGRGYRVRAELLHLYGVSYMKNLAIATYGAAATALYNFYPTGFVTIRVSVVDAATSKVVGERILSETFLFNPAHPFLTTGHTAYGPGVRILNNRTQVAIIALRQAMVRLPYVVDQLLAQTVPDAEAAAPRKTFLLTRLTREYEFEEQVEAELETGRIIRDELVPRTFPVYSRPDEWVVARISPQGHWLTLQAYRDLLGQLGQRYKIESGANQSAALFRGVLARAPTAPPAEGTTPPPVGPTPVE